jgi:HEAT repeat protein
VAPLVARLGDRDPEVRREAALSLGYLGERRAAPSLQALARRDPSDRVREAAAFAAGLLGP